MDIKALEAEIENIEEFHQVVIFNSKEIISKKNCEPNMEELKMYFNFYANRDDTIKSGFMFNKEYFEVHRFHPPLIYGRMPNENKEKGISLCKGTNKENEEIYFLIIYKLPYLSARCIPIQVEIFNKFIGTVGEFKEE